LYIPNDAERTILKFAHWIPINLPRHGLCPSVQHIAPIEEHCHNSKNTAFQERGKTTGMGDAIASKEQRHFSPLAAIL
jgi:hypothetical protein